MDKESDPLTQLQYTGAWLKSYDTENDKDDHKMRISEMLDRSVEITNILNRVRDGFLDRSRTFDGDENPDPEDINGGQCADFASVAYDRLVKYQPKILSTRAKGGHVLLKISNRYYDATHTTGEKTVGDVDKDYKGWADDRFDILSKDQLHKSWKLHKPYHKAINKLIDK